MGIPVSDQKKLCLRSGGLCAMCRRHLTASAPIEGVVILGEMAHIVAESPDGPRGDHSLPLDDRNRYENLIFLCNVDHQRIDDQPHTFTVERLHGIKEDHEKWAEKTLGVLSEETLSAPPPVVSEVLYSTLLSVEHMPSYVYGVECEIQREADVRPHLLRPRQGEMVPYILRGGTLWAFQSMAESGSPFQDLIAGRKVTRVRATQWWEDSDKSAWFVSLLNRSLNKLTGWRGLRLDKDHHRYYFPASDAGAEVEITYRPLNQEKATISAAWQPKRRATGEPKNHWLHRAVALRFLRVSERSWCLSLRPEIHVTEDGHTPVRSDLVGRRVTRKKSRMYNYDFLRAIQFWRDYLSDGNPRILMNFHSPGQYISISTSLMEGSVTWPGIPEKYRKPFENIHYEEDLFTYGDLRELREAEAEADDEDWDEEIDSDLEDETEEDADEA